VVIHSCNPSSQEVEAGISGSEFQASLGYETLSQKNKAKQYKAKWKKKKPQKNI
jgi:hypothetical protein